MAVSFTQTAFRLRNDDGTEVTATWKAAANTNINVDMLGGNVPLRIRLCAQETGTTAATFAANLFMSKNGGAYAQVTAATANAKVIDSANFVDNANTTQQVSAFTFVAGRMDDVDGTTGATASIVQNSGTEFEFMVQLVAADLANGDTLDFRVYRSGVAIAVYTNTPRITIFEDAINVSQPVGAADQSPSLTVSTSLVNVSEAIAVSESITVDPPSSGALTVNKSEAITVTEGTPLVTIDTSTVSVSQPVSVAESDTVAVGTTINASQPVAVAETASENVSTTINVSQAIGAADQTASLVVNLTANVSQPVSVAESASETVSTPTVNVSQPISVAETASVNAGGQVLISVSQPVSVTENIGLVVLVPDVPNLSSGDTQPRRLFGPDERIQTREDIMAAIMMVLVDD